MKIENMDFISRHQEFFIRVISCFYPFTPEQLINYRDVLDPILLSKNPSQKHLIPDSLIQLIERFQLISDPVDEDDTIIPYISDDKILMKIKQVETEKLKLDEKSLEHLIIEVASEDQPIHRQAICSNTKLPWSISFIEKLQSLYCVDWPSLSMNPALPWDDKFIDYFLDQWWWGGMVTEEKSFAKKYSKGLLDNTTIPWNIDWLIRYEDYIDFDLLAENEIIWEKVFKHYIDNSFIDLFLNPSR